MDRRAFVRNLLAGGAAFAVSACGGGGASSGGAAPTGSGDGPTAAPAPTPTATPVSVPTLKGVTIDQAEGEIREAFAEGIQWVSRTPAYQNEIVVSSADEFADAITRIHDLTANAQSLALNHRIQLAWNGPSQLAAGASARLTIGQKNMADSFLAQGGSLTIQAADGYKPSLANATYVAGRGIKIAGVGFVRRRLGGEDPMSVSALYVTSSSTYPASPVVHFEGCWIGANSETDVPWQDWIHGVTTQGLADYVSFSRCQFRGTRTAATLVAKAARIDFCDFRNVLVDCIAMRNHRFGTDYYAHGWISHTTFRDAPTSWDLRDTHCDAVQTGTSSDEHMGYRMLMTDNIVHLKRVYAGSNGGGGPQGFYNSDYASADNQFVVRRSIILAASPRGFNFYSPRATRPSFVDRSTVMRAGTVPSSFNPDPYSLDWVVGLAGETVPQGTWLLVTSSIGKSLIAGEAAQLDLIDLDPRARAASEVRPETIFKGRNFSRGGSPVNGEAGKFGYEFANEAGSQAAFVADVWANFAPNSDQADYGWPAPATTGWMA